MTYNLHEIMCKAWKLFRKGIGRFAECLHRAWNSAKAEPINAQRISDLIIYASKGDGQTYRARFFPASVTQPLNA